MKKKGLLRLAFIFTILFLFTGSAFCFTAQRIIIPYSTVENVWWAGLAIHNESNAAQTYSVWFYDESGTAIAGDCVTVPAHGIEKGLLQNFADDPAEVSGAVSIYIRTAGASTDRFSATLFVGNENVNGSQGFGFQAFQSEDYETTMVILCDIILPL